MSSPTVRRECLTKGFQACAFDLFNALTLFPQARDLVERVAKQRVTRLVECPPQPSKYVINHHILPTVNVHVR